MKGIVRLVKTKQDPTTGKEIVTEDRTVENELSVLYYDRFVNGSIPDGDTLEVWISEYDFVGPGADLSFLGVNAYISGTRNSYTYTPNTSTTPGIHQWSYTFNPPAATDRTIRSISVSNMTILSVYSDPCIQTPGETLTVFYNIINELASPADYPDMSEAQLERFQKIFWLGDNDITIQNLIPEMRLSNIPASVMNASGFSERLGNTNGGTASSSSVLTVIVPEEGDVDYKQSSEEGYFRGSRNFASATTNIGLLVSSVRFNGKYTNQSLGLNRIAPARDILPLGTSTIQNTFHRNSLDIGSSYQDTGQQGNGTGTITIDDTDGWIGPNSFASKYKIEIVNGGDLSLGEVTYRIYKQYHTGDQSNTGISAAYQVPCQPYKNSSFVNLGTSNGSIFDNQHGVPTWDTDSHNSDVVITDSPNLVKFRVPEFISWDKTGISFNNISGEPQVHLDNITEPSFTAAAIMQVVVAKNYDIYIACRLTGLWRVIWDHQNRTVSSVTNIVGTGSITLNNTQCWGVQVKESDQSLWALYSSQDGVTYVMNKSTDNGVTWSEQYDPTTDPQFSILGLTDSGGEAYPITIHIDPTHADDRFLIPISFNQDGSLTRGDSRSYAWWSRGASSPSSDGQLQFHSNNFAYTASRFKSASCTRCTLSGIWLSLGDDRGGNSGQVRALDAAKYGDPFVEVKSTSGLSNSLNIPLIVEDGEEVLRSDSSELIKTSDWSSTVPGSVPSTLLSSATSPSLINSITSICGPDAQTPENAWRPLAQYYLHLGANLHLMTPGLLTEYAQWVSGGSVGYTALHGSALFSTIDWGMYEVYGWNGTGWERGITTPRAASTNRETIIDGLGLTFSGSGATSFISNESFDTYVYNGVLKDNATTLTNIRGELLYGFPRAGSTSATVIPTAPNNVVTEPMWGFRWDERDGEPETVVYSRRGYHSTETFNNNDLGVFFEHAYEGDFTLKIKVGNMYAQADSGFSLNDVQFVIMDASIPSDDLITPDQNFSVTRDQERFYPRYSNIANPSGQIEYAFVADASTASATQGTQQTTQDDWWVFNRTGNTVAWSYEDVTAGTTTILYTSSESRSAAAYRPLLLINERQPISITDSEATFTENRCLIDLGDSVLQTGRFDPKFRKIVTTPDLRKDNIVTMDGVEVIVNYDTHIPPAVGEVNMLPYSGRLWCNQADAGRTITATFNYIRDFN